LVRLDSPVDVAAMLDPDDLGKKTSVLFAISVPLADYGQALSALRSQGKSLERLSRDMHFVTLPDEQRCIVARANGVATARLVCSDGRADVEALAPYMASALPLESFGPQAAYIELRAEPLRERFGKDAQLIKVGVPIFLREASLGNPRFDSALADAAHGGAGEILALIDDLDRVVLRANSGRQKEALHLEFELAHKGARSWFAKTLNAVADDSDVAPPIAWRLPVDASSASYTAAVKDTSHWQAPLATLSELASGGFEHFGLTQKVYKDLVTTWSAAMQSGGAVSYAQGSGTRGAAAASGWEWLLDDTAYTLVGSEGDGGSWARALETAVAAYNDPVWRKELAKRLEFAALLKLPNVTKRPPPAALGLPKGSQLYELAISPEVMTALGQAEASLPKPDRPLRVSICVVPSGAQTWVAYGTDPALLASKIKLALSAPSEQTLAARQGLEAWRTERAISAGFFSVATLFQSLAHYVNSTAAQRADESSGQSKSDAISGDQFTLAMPGKGKAPISYTFKVEPGPALRFSVTVPAAAMEDLAAGTVAALAAAGDTF
jgi:hypothetical protein